MFHRGNVVRYPHSTREMTIHYGPFRTHVFGAEFYLAKTGAGIMRLCAATSLELVREGTDPLVDVVAQWLLKDDAAFDGATLSDLTASSIDAYRASAQSLIDHVNKES